MRLLKYLDQIAKTSVLFDGYVLFYNSSSLCTWISKKDWNAIPWSTCPVTGYSIRKGKYWSVDFEYWNHPVQDDKGFYVRVLGLELTVDL